MSSQTFTPTGAAQTFTVPAGVTAVKCALWGAPGGDTLCGTIVGGTTYRPKAGVGGYSEGVLAVTPGQTLYLFVGGAGVPGDWPGRYHGQGGWNGGNYGINGGGGGGATDVRVGGTGLANRKLVAGGGGGAGWIGYATPWAVANLFPAGGDGGGLNGQDAPYPPQTYTLTISGSPTGGTFTFNFYTANTGTPIDDFLNSATWGGYVTSRSVTVAYNATPAAFQTALRAYDANATVTGTAGAWNVTLTSIIGNGQASASVSATSFTGGTSPYIVVGYSGVDSEPGRGGLQTANTHSHPVNAGSDGALGVGGSAGNQSSASFGGGSSAYILTSKRPGGATTVVDTSNCPTGGGGGGGGYYGGGGGAGGATQADPTGTNGVSGGGGAGGSGYADPAVTSPILETSATTHPNPAPSGGYAILSWNNPPLAPTLTSPATGNTIVASSPVTVTWQFNDPDAGDTQSAADVQWRISGGSTWTTISGAATTASSYTFTAGTFATGNTYEWQVRTYDSSSAVGPWSASSFFTAGSTPPAPTITSPTAGATVTVATQPVSWTLPAGYSQVGYQLRRTDGGSTIYWTGAQVNSTAQTGYVQMDAVSGRTDHLQVSFNATGFWSPWADVAVDVELGPPAAPTGLATCFPNQAYVTVAITNPTPGAGQSATVSNDLTRTSPDGTTARIATGLAPNATYTDYLPGAGQNIYTITGWAANGSSASGQAIDNGDEYITYTITDNGDESYTITTPPIYTITDNGDESYTITTP